MGSGMSIRDRRKTKQGGTLKTGLTKAFISQHAKAAGLRPKMKTFLEKEGDPQWLACPNPAERDFISRSLVADKVVTSYRETQRECL